MMRHNGLRSLALLNRYGIELFIEPRDVYFPSGCCSLRLLQSLLSRDRLAKGVRPARALLTLRHVGIRVQALLNSDL